jgi:uncharacterized delta-60 repeat protein
MAILLILTSHAQAPIDPTFASNGWFNGVAAAGNAFAKDVAIDQNGSIILGGPGSTPPFFNHDDSYLAVTRLTSSGIVDTTFGDQGVFSQWVGWIDDVLVESCPDGGVLLVCNMRDDQMAQSFVLKLDVGGHPDSSFGTLGTGSTGILPDMGLVQRVLMLPDGGFLLVLTTSGVYSGIIRFHADGSRDMIFGTDGLASVSLPNGYEATALVPHLLADGKILVTGPSIDPFSAAPAEAYVGRFTANGLPDTGFANNGLSIFQLTDHPVDVYLNYSAIAPDGTIWLAGMSEVAGADFHYAIAKVAPEGLLDTTFGNGSGHVLYANGGTNDEPVVDMPMSDFLLLPNGKFMIYSTYYGYMAEHFQCELLRFNQDGSLDGSFADQGRMFFLDPYGGSSSKMALQADGKVIAAGGWYNPGTEQFGFNCLRLLADDASGVSTPQITHQKPPSASPNPAHDQVRVNYSAKGNGPVSISLRDVQGRICMNWPVSHGGITGERTEVLTLPPLITPGLYFLEVQGAIERQVVKLQVE